MDLADFRSDTVTRPCKKMRAAIAAAPVGDDVFGDDPTVIRLQRVLADLLGMEEALFMPSGTMGNQVALHVHCSPGDEVLVDPKSHIFNYEGGGAARFSGIQLRPVEAPEGIFQLLDLKDSLRDPGDCHQPFSRLLVVENPHNMRGGVVVGPEVHDQMIGFCEAHGLLLHVDGARIWNAAIAAGVEPARLLKGADSAMVCLSKGLGAPVGSVLLGSSSFVDKAKRARKAFGGGLRQVGILAAAGLVALEDWENQVALDHRRTKALATGLKELPGIMVDPEKNPTNMVFIKVEEGPEAAARLVAGLADRGVLALALGDQIRMVIHLDLSDQDVEQALQAFQVLLQ